MAWWTAVPALTPLVAHDALRVSATHFLDGVGTNNMGLAGCTPGAAFPVAAYNGGGAEMPYTSSITLPTSGVLLAFVKPFGASQSFYNSAGLGYALGQEPDGRAYTYSGTDGLLAGAGVVPFGVLRFWALVFGAATAQLYLNGSYVGNTVARSTVMAAVGGVGYLEAPYAYRAADQLSAFGLLSGAPTLAEMQALEAAVRAELAAPQPNTNILSFAPLASSVGAQAVGTPSAQVVDVGRVRVRLSAGFAGFGVVQGVVTVNNVPASKLVRLLDSATGVLVATTQSAGDGSYSFAGVAEGREYTVLSHDQNRIYNAVVSDRVIP